MKYSIVYTIKNYPTPNYPIAGIVEGENAENAIALFRAAHPNTDKILSVRLIFKVEAENFYLTDEKGHCPQLNEIDRILKIRE